MSEGLLFFIVEILSQGVGYVKLSFQPGRPQSASIFSLDFNIPVRQLEPDILHLVIRKTKSSDYRQIESLIKSVDRFWDKNWRKNVVELGADSSNNLSYVYVHNDNILGFVCAHDCGFRAYLSELVVNPSIQGKGVATQLLKKVENELKKRKCKTLIADVWKDSLGFYKRQGWSKPNVILMRKKVG